MKNFGTSFKQAEVRAFCTAASEPFIPNQIEKILASYWLIQYFTRL